MPLRHTRAAIFDLDGTLVDSLPDIAGHLNAALADAGLKTYSSDEIRKWVGSGAAHLVRGAVGGDLVGAAHDNDVENVLARFRTYYRAAPYARTSVFAGLAEALDTIGVGRQLAILSNKPHDLVVTIAEALLARWAFREVVGERVGTPRKPDPTGLLAVANALGVPAEACVMVGDSEIDVATAKAAGMKCVAVTWGLCDVEVLRDATHVVSTPAELARLFGASVG